MHALTKNPRFMLPAGMLISNFGNGMYLLAVAMILYKTSGSSSKFALLIILQAVGVLSMQLFASVAADSGFAKRLASAAEFIRGSLVMLAALLATLGFDYSLVIVAFLLSLVQPFFRTSIFKIGPLISSDVSLAKFNARTSVFQQVGLFLGAAAAGPLMEVWLYLPLWLNAITYFFSSLSVFLSEIPEQNSQKITLSWLCSIFHFKKALYDWRDVFVALRGNGIVLWLAFFASADHVIVNFLNMLYPPLLNTLNADNVFISAWDLSFALGAITGASIFGSLVILQKPIKIIPFFIVFELISLLLIPLSNKFLVVALFLFIGVFNSMSVAAVSLKLQTLMPVKYTGRIAGLRQLFLTLVSLLVIPLVTVQLDTTIPAGINSVVLYSIISSALLIVAIIVFTRKKKTLAN